uniref:Uncharacterized protein n=1 Tax=Plectus sambesii TaxID=2011161 RepID=A0A914UJQ1_9BILA
MSSLVEQKHRATAISVVPPPSCLVAHSLVGPRSTASTASADANAARLEAHFSCRRFCRLPYVFRFRNWPPVGATLDGIVRTRAPLALPVRLAPSSLLRYVNAGLELRQRTLD